MKCSDIEKQLELFIPKGLAQTDKKENTGLIVGRSDKNVSTIIVAYRIDQETIDYAVSAQADMIISYDFNNWKHQLSGPPFTAVATP